MRHRGRITVALTLALAIAGSAPAQTTSLPPVAIDEDLTQFQDELEQRFTYFAVNNPDYRSAIQAIRERAAGGMSLHDFRVELNKVIGLFIDGHGHVWGHPLPAGYLPFRLEPIGRRYVAFWPDRSDFVDPSFPYIERIDGKTIGGFWHRELRPGITRGSRSFVRYFVLRDLEHIQFARSMAGRERDRNVTIVLRSRDGKKRTSRTLRVAKERPTVEHWPSQGSHRMDGNIGYLRIDSWWTTAFSIVEQWMSRFHSTRGLIIDVRHNRGGTRRVLEDLYPFFVRASDPPRVANAAKYRLYSGFGTDHLTGRHMYRRDWTGWSDAESSSIDAFMETFVPEWTVPAQDFSDWHFWVLSKKTNPDVYSYGKPVIFLMDEKCLSASDVILSAVKGMPNVTLIGAPSSGASGAVIYTFLQNSGLEVGLSSMASFQRTGSLYDSRGVQPDVALDPDPEYYLEGGPDRVLEHAVRMIRESS